MRPLVGPGIDVIAWNLAEGEREAYQAAFQRARAAAAVEQAFEESETAALDVVYEAHHAGLNLLDIGRLLGNGP